MPFGKYRGQPLDDLPTDYLEWCVQELDQDRNGTLIEEMLAQLAMRRGEGVLRKKGRLG